MQLHRQAAYFPTDFRTQPTYLIALTSLFLLTPFAVINLLQDRSMIAIAALTIIAIQGFHAWDINRGNNRPWVVLFVLTPCILTFLVLCFHTQGIIAALWTYPAILFYYCTLDDRKAWLANAVTLICVVPQAWVVLDAELAARVSATLFAVSVFSAISSRATTSYQKKLEDRIISDPLTGLLNRSVLNVTLNAAVEHYQRLGTPMTLMLLDLDHFKKVNDTWGHDTGDKVLVEVSNIIKESTRLSDSCFRIGGEEFLCLLYGSDLENGKRIANKIRLQLQNKDTIPGHVTTASIGVASIRRDDTWQSWNSRTDKRLYQAKHAGRNTVA